MLLMFLIRCRKIHLIFVLYFHEKNWGGKSVVIAMIWLFTFRTISTFCPWRLMQDMKHVIQILLQWQGQYDRWIFSNLATVYIGKLLHRYQQRPGMFQSYQSKGRGLRNLPPSLRSWNFSIYANPRAWNCQQNRVTIFVYFQFITFLESFWLLFIYCT